VGGGTGGDNKFERIDDISSIDDTLCSRQLVQ